MCSLASLISASWIPKDPAGLNIIVIGLSSSRGEIETQSVREGEKPFACIK